MKTPTMFRLLLFVVVLITAPAVYGQTDATRDKTKERLSALLTRVGPEINVTFATHPKNPFSFIGVMTEGLTNAEKLEIVISATASQTIGIQVFPHYKGNYVNIDKVRNTVQLLRKLVQLNETNFLFWGADATGDVFTGYTFTLESGFPDEALKIVLSSIKGTDKYVGELRPSIDGSNAP